MTEKKKGPPFKYNDDMQEKAEAYVNGGFAGEGDVVPTIEGLASALGVVTRTVYNWSEDYEPLLQTLNEIKEKQKRLLVNKGLSGDFNSTIAKLMLSNHGIRETNVQELSNPDGTLKPTVIELVAKDDSSKN